MRNRQGKEKLPLTNMKSERVYRKKDIKSFFDTTHTHTAQKIILGDASL